MTEEEERIRDIVLEAHTSKFKENSNLVADMLSKMERHIDRAVEKSFNGKIDKLDKKIDDEFKKHNKKMEPIYELYKYGNKTGKFIIRMGQIFLAIGAIVAAFVAIFTAITKYLK